MMSIYEATGVFQNVFVFGFIVDIVIIALVILAKKSSRTPALVERVAVDHLFV